MTRPPAREKSRTFQPMQRRVNGSLRQVKHPSAAFVQLLNDGVPMRRLRFHGGEDKEVEVALQELTVHTY